MLKLRSARELVRMAAVLMVLFAGVDPLIQVGFAQTQNNRRRVYTNDDIPSRGEAKPAPTNAKPNELEPEQTREAEAKRIAPFVTTPMVVVEKMLEIAQVTTSDVVFDLGSGDGRIVFAAAQKHGARGVGVELDHRLVVESTEKVKELKLEDLVTIREEDLLKTDLSTATVVTVYLLLEANSELRPVLEKQLRPGTRVVAHDIRIPGWESSQQAEVKADGNTHFVYLYKVPDAFRK